MTDRDTATARETLTYRPRRLDSKRPTSPKSEPVWNTLTSRAHALVVSDRCVRGVLGRRRRSRPHMSHTAGTTTACKGCKDGLQGFRETAGQRRPGVRAGTSIKALISGLWSDEPSADAGRRFRNLPEINPADSLQDAAPARTARARWSA